MPTQAELPLPRRNAVELLLVLPFAASYTAEILSGLRYSKERDFRVDFRFGRHWLVPEMITPQTRLVLGEVDLTKLHNLTRLKELGEKDFLKLHTPKEGLSGSIEEATESLLHRTTNTTTLDRFREAQALVLIRQNRIHLVATDTHHFVTVKDGVRNRLYTELDKPGAFQTLLSLSAIGVTLPFLLPKSGPKLIGSKLGRFIYDKVIIPGDLLAFVTAFVVISRNTGVGLLQWAGLSQKEANKLYDYIEALFDNDLQVFHRLSRIRDIAMVLNTRHTQALLNQMPEFKNALLGNEADSVGANVLFFAGGQHKDAEHKFSQSSLDLEIEIMGHADYLLDFYMERLTQEFSNLDTLDETRVVEIFQDIVLAFSPFSVPVPDFTDEPEFQSANRRNLPDSPRTLLYRLIKYKLDALLPDKQALRELPPEKQGEIILLRTIYELLHQEDIGFYYYTPIPQIASMRRRAETLAGQSEKLDFHFGNIYSELMVIDGIPYIIAPWLDPQSPEDTASRFSKIATAVKVGLKSII